MFSDPPSCQLCPFHNCVSWHPFSRHRGHLGQNAADRTTPCLGCCLCSSSQTPKWESSTKSGPHLWGRNGLKLLQTCSLKTKLWVLCGWLPAVTQRYPTFLWYASGMWLYRMNLRRASLALDMHGSRTYWRIFLVWCILKCVLITPSHCTAKAPICCHSYSAALLQQHIRVQVWRSLYACVWVFGMYQLLLNGYFSDSWTQGKMAKVELTNRLFWQMIGKRYVFGLDKKSEVLKGLVVLWKRKGVSEFLLGLEEIRNEKNKSFQSFQGFQAPFLSSMMTFIMFSCTIFNQTQNNDCSHSDYKTIIKTQIVSLPGSYGLCSRGSSVSSWASCLRRLLTLFCSSLLYSMMWTISS